MPLFVVVVVVYDKICLFYLSGCWPFILWNLRLCPEFSVRGMIKSGQVYEFFLPFVKTVKMTWLSKLLIVVNRFWTVLSLKNRIARKIKLVQWKYPIMKPDVPVWDIFPSGSRCWFNALWMHSWHW